MKKLGGGTEGITMAVAKVSVDCLLSHFGPIRSRHLKVHWSQTYLTNLVWIKGN